MERGKAGLCVVLLLIYSVCVKLPLAKLPLPKLQPTFFGFFQPSSQLQCVGACEDVCLKLQLVDACEALTNKAPAKVFLGFFRFLLFCQLAFSVTIFLCEVFSAFNQLVKSNQPMFFVFFQPACSTINQPTITQHVEPLLS